MTDNPPAIDAQIGQRLRAARTAAQLTLRQLAARLGWPYTTLANYEEGRRPLRVAQLSAIAAALGQSPAAFLVDLPVAASMATSTAACRSPSCSTPWTASRVGSDEPRITCRPDTCRSYAAASTLG